jgi:multicomponent Na+:H+ antiporter subunit D
VGLAASSSLGLTPAIMHMVNHAIIKGAMFMAACGFIHRLNLTRISGFSGLSKKMPFSVLALILACLAMIGLPPGGGFVSKWFLILSAIDAGQYVFVAVIFISTLLMLVYFWRLIETMYIRPAKTSGGQGTGSKNELPMKELPMGMMLPVLIMTIFSFLIGFVWISKGGDVFLIALNQSLGLGT